MKKIIIAFCFLCATAAFSQTAAVLSNNPQPVILTDHPMRATMHSMATEANLRGSGTYSYEHGERPLWEFPSDKHETPLGDVARAYRKEHAFEKRAVIVMEK